MQEALRNPGLRGAGMLLAAVSLLAAPVGCRPARRSQSSTETVTLRVADWGGASADPAISRFERDVMAEWQRLHPNVRIAPEHIPGSDVYVSKMLTAFVADTEPDVMALDASSAAVFIENDTLLDLMPFVSKDSLDLAVYYPNVLDMARRGPRLYALPADFTPLMVYYNKKKFVEAGVPFPRDGWTWDEFHDDCRRLTIWPSGASHPVQYGFELQNWMPGWIPWIWQNGGDVLSPDGRQAAGSLNGPASVEALDFVAALVKEKLAPSLSESQAQGADPFQSGLTAMQVSGHWNLVGLKASEKLKMSDVGVVGLPQKRKRVTALYESGYAITKGCRHRAEAWEYVKFMSGPFVQRRKAELGIGISANREVAEARRGSTALEEEFLDNIRFGVAPKGATVESYAQVEDIGREAMEEILVGGRPASSAMTDAAKRIDAELYF